MPIGLTSFETETSFVHQIYFLTKLLHSCSIYIHFLVATNTNNFSISLHLAFICPHLKMDHLQHTVLSKMHGLYSVCISQDLINTINEYAMSFCLKLEYSNPRGRKPISSSTSLCTSVRYCFWHWHTQDMCLH